MRRFVFFAVVLVISLFDCGDLDVMLSSGKLYTVNAAINGVTLDECAIIQKDSKLSPYFDFNIKDDPDVSGLVVYIKDDTGKKVGPGILYKLSPRNAESLSENAENGESEDTSSENLSEPDYTDDKSAESTDNSGLLVGETAPYTDTSDTTIENDSSLAAETVSKGNADISDNTESDLSYTENNTENTFTQTDYDPIANNDVETYIDNYADNNIVISVDNIDNGLPDLTFGNDLKYGAYTIVFEIIATNKAILNRIEKPFFYLAGKKLAINEVVSYLPGISTAMRIVPPGEKIMLEVDIEADPTINPYVIWYNGRQRISEGFVSNGQNRILWKVPAQTVFQNIRVEVFPFSPNRLASFMPGLNYSVSLPVSQRHGRSSHYSETETWLSRWYRLWGTVIDHKDPINIASALARMGEGSARWLPVSGTYGLAINAGNAYKVPGSFFSRIRRGEGSGEILFLFAPQNGKDAEGTVVRVVLQGHYVEDETARDCTIWVSVYNDNLVLHAVGVDGTLLSRQIPLSITNVNVFMSVSIDFQFFETGTTASIGVENIETGEIEQWESLDIDFVTDGEGSIQFGGPFDPPVFTDEPAGVYPGILNEIALRYNEISPLTPPPPAETPELTENDGYLLEDADPNTQV
jgi:hypothetical protein